MKRVACQLLFCSPTDVRKMHAIEIDEQHKITNIFDLSNRPVESAHTLFYDGIISAVPISLKQFSLAKSTITDKFCYIDLCNSTNTDATKISKPLILDFGTSEIDEINTILKQNHFILKQFTLYEIINASVYTPATIINTDRNLKIGLTIDLILWQQVDLVNKRLQPYSQIKSLYHLGNK